MIVNDFEVPKKIKKIIEFFLTDFNDNATVGDMEEEFYFLANEKDIKLAKKWYLKMAIKSLPKLIIHSIYWGNTMIKNYFKIAIRSLIKQKMYSAINISGLAIGMVVSIFILLFVQNELNYDKYHENADRIFRLERIFTSPDGSTSSGFASLAPSFVPWLENEFPEFENIARIFHINNANVKYEDNYYEESRFFVAEKDVFEIFTIPLIKGSQESALKAPNSVVISQAMSKKYFGDKNPMGEMIKVDNQFELKITGVFKNTPEASHIHFDFIGSYISLKGLHKINGEDYFLGNTNFSDNITYAYAKIINNVNVEDIKDKLPAALDNRFGEIKLGDGKFAMASKLTSIKFTPVPDIHLFSKTKKEIEANGSITYVTIFTIVSIFILLIACINFMNLSTARAMKRAREVGLRKVIGAHKKMLIIQFLGESIFVSLISLIVSTILLYVVHPYLNLFTGVNISLNLFGNVFHFFILAGIFIFSGIIAGIYPALYLSSFNPSTILRGEVTKGTKGSLFRKILVVGQFSISIALIISVLVVNNQINFLKDTDLGYDKENIVIISADKIIKENWDMVKAGLKRNSKIVSAALSKRVPSGQLNDDAGFVAQFNNKKFDHTFSMPHNRVSHDFFKTYGMQFVAGRDFSVQHITDSTLAYILNEKAVKMFGIKNPEDAIGMKIGYRELKGKVIGIVKDFNYESLHKDIIPVMTYISYGAANTMSIKIQKGEINATIDYIKSVIHQYHPGYNFSFSFLDDRLNSLYRNENQMLDMFSSFSILAIFIACLGLFGLAAYTAEQKTMEIGIRKVHGASIVDIIFRLSKEFTYLVLFGSVIAVPTAYYFVNKWLETFAYSISFGFSTIMLAIVITLFIALFTVSFQALRAARANPVESLKCE